ncbi:hypothetical protein [Shinella sp. NM-101]|uniref:hypothetical protein n=1 Tax=Shinella sp. NM-101 TaxID=2744455 RepID=UPI001AD42259|nr:hypothetical protein [Shinella sp. NM-101]MBN9057557.1 hypothetical protein [Hyphomicrobiales bacterium]
MLSMFFSRVPLAHAQKGGKCPGMAKIRDLDSLFRGIGAFRPGANASALVGAISAKGGMARLRRNLKIGIYVTGAPIPYS